MDVDRNRRRHKANGVVARWDARRRRGRRVYKRYRGPDDQSHSTDDRWSLRVSSRWSCDFGGFGASAAGSSSRTRLERVHLIPEGNLDISAWVAFVECVYDGVGIF